MQTDYRSLSVLLHERKNKTSGVWVLSGAILIIFFYFKKIAGEVRVLLGAMEWAADIRRGDKRRRWRRRLPCARMLTYADVC